MKSLKTKLFEGFYKNAGGMVCPTTVDELRREIKTRLSQGQYNLNDIDTSKITDMSYLFSGYKDIPDIDISKWDTSKVEDMSYMFFNCKKFNSDLSSWDVSNVTNMNSMFYGCEKFNCDLSKWNVSRVDKYMSSMFKGAGMKKLPKWYENS